MLIVSISIVQRFLPPTRPGRRRGQLLRPAGMRSSCCTATCKIACSQVGHTGTGCLKHRMNRRWRAGSFIGYSRRAMHGATMEGRE